MWTDPNPYLLIYLLGSVLVLLLYIFNLVFLRLLAWITKGNVLAKNLKKLEPPDEGSRIAKLLISMIGVVLELALSWVGVIFQIWITASTLLRTLREALVSTPEAIKLLRFPLRNNPNMSREAVWAYVHALAVRAGDKQPEGETLLYSLNDVLEAHPSFDRKAALNELKGLKVVTDEAISSTLYRMSLPEEELGEPPEEELGELDQLQADFESRLAANYDLPDGIRGREAYIYWNLMRKWFSRLIAANRYDDERAKKLRRDWVDYIELLPRAMTSRFLALEIDDKVKASAYDREAELASRSVEHIQDAFAAAVGADATEELRNVRNRAPDAFDRSGTQPVAPKGYRYFPTSISPYVEECQPIHSDRPHGEA